MKKTENQTILVALAGNPNSGKTSLFNSIVGTHLKVGNYPGVTIEKTEGALKHGGYKITFVDLPGTYSLSPYSPEEVIT
ncbi:ferrous iron transport protein B, partial [Candidatus Termititenax persephonae]